MVSTNMCTTIMYFTLLQAFEYRIQHMAPVHTYNLVQKYMTIYTNTSQTQIQYKLDEARKKLA